ncbi:cadherin-like beta sandwich domain-containing protein [Paenibacillus filicis]|uniref:Cadherin-like beta sandwich domain-containing protein n=1 Tax=Paenibacillus filicis TaxID=669464 RepID=A0ABU9DJH2_9BACL
MRNIRVWLAGLAAVLLVLCFSWETRASGPDSEADLQSIYAGAGVLSPAFDPSITEYSQRIDSGLPGYFTAAIGHNPAAAIEYSMNRGEWKPIPHNTSTGYLETYRGENAFRLKVTAPDGVTVKLYTVHVYFPEMTDADLIDLQTDKAVLSPVFSRDYTGYTASVPYATGAISLTATLSDPAASLEIEGVPVVNRIPHGPIPLAVGSNTLQIKTGSSDGLTNRIYTVTVTRVAPSADAKLSALEVPAYSLSPLFTPNQPTYDLPDVGFAISELIVKPKASDSAATTKVRVNGGSYTAVENGVSSAPLALDVGPNTLEVQVTAEDGTTKRTYEIHVKRQSDNAWLSDLVIQPGVLNEPFASDRFTYTMSDVGYEVDTVAITPKLEDTTRAYVQVRVNGGSYRPVTSGYPMSFQLTVGSNIIEAEVWAEDTSIKKNYTVEVTRQNKNAMLSGLKVSPGMLNEPFASDRFEYTMADVGYAVGSLVVKPTLSDALHASVRLRVNGGEYTPGQSGEETALPLAVGENWIDIEVSAQDTSYRKLYQIKLHRQSNEASLSGLEVKPGTLNEPFASERLAYTMADVPYSTSSLTLLPALADPAGASVDVQINGSGFVSLKDAPSSVVPLSVGINRIDLRVQAQDPSFTKLYSVTVARKKNSDASLAGLAVSAGSLDFSSHTADYTLTVSKATYSLKVRPTLEAGNIAATVQVRINNGSYAAVQSGLDSPELVLNAGEPNVIQVLVTAQDGTTRMYTILVIQSGTPVLNGIALEGNRLKLTFSEPLLRSVTDTSYYSIYHVTRQAAMTVTEVVYTAGSAEVNLTLSGLLQPADELEIKIGAGAVTSYIGETNAEIIRTVYYGTPLEQLYRRLKDLDTDRTGIRINHVLAYLKSPFGQTDLNGDGVFNREDVALMLEFLGTTLTLDPTSP